MKKTFLFSCCVILALFLLNACGKKTSLEGKVVDGKNKPMAGVKLIAKQVQPIKGYEQFETETSSDGTFRFKKLFPTSEYILIPWFDDWTEAPLRTLKYEADKLNAHFKKEGWATEKKMKIQSGPDGETILLASDIVIQPVVTIVGGKVVDGKGRPMAGVKVFAKQKIPVPGYEQFDDVTSADGTFKFTRLFPRSLYSFIPAIKNKLGNVITKGMTKGVQEESTVAAIRIRFTKANNVVIDTKTNLMWAAMDNGQDIDAYKAKAFCEDYKGGGYSDWRLPTYSELLVFYKGGMLRGKGELFAWKTSGAYGWWSKDVVPGGKKQYLLYSNKYGMFYGTRGEWRPGYSKAMRVIPVRSNK
jgi:Protein of unknown function (DUF1566)